jgi:ergothioneine biosynthesis protein EgtB
MEYRRFVDVRVLELLEGTEIEGTRFGEVMRIGLEHERQHQELMVTDVKHMFSCNPLLPGPYSWERERFDEASLPPASCRGFGGGIASIGGDPSDGFRFDNELPRHRVFLEPFEIADRPVSNGEYMAFIEDGGYERPELWLSMGWATVSEEGWRHPLYWYRNEGAWWEYTLAGARPVRADEPVCHLSYYEADAYARWAGARLPTEFEWEHAAGDVPMDGVIADEGRFHPGVLDASVGEPTRFFGDVWEWTSSSYGPYPGFETPEGALGEYNGKFMCNQYVLRGGSCATARTQARLTYRNFFPPEARWQFAGVRLARTVSTGGRDED